MKLRALTFDAYGTLLQEARTPLVELSRHIVNHYGLSLEAESFLHLWEEEFYSLLRRRFLGMEEANVLSLSRLLHSMGLESRGEALFQLVVEKWASRPAYPEVRGVLMKLEEWPVALVTNADDRTLRRALETNGLDFPLIVTSESVKAYKPDPKPFRRVVEMLRVGAEEILHVGDSLVDDVAGAKAMGMKTAWINRDGLRPSEDDPQPDFVLQSLEQLPEILSSFHGPAGR